MLQVRHKNHKEKIESSAIDVLIEKKSNARKVKQFTEQQSVDQNLQESSGVASKLDFSPIV